MIMPTDQDSYLNHNICQMNWNFFFYHTECRSTAADLQAGSLLAVLNQFSVLSAFYYWKKYF